MTDAGADSVEMLVRTLTSDDAAERMKARHHLVSIGKSAVAAVAALLIHPQTHVRWEAAKTLAELADPVSIPPLIDAVQDRDKDVRWAVGEALVAMGPNAIVPVLTSLLVDPDNPTGLYENGYQVLYALAVGQVRPVLTPVLQALRQDEPEVAVPAAAATALEALASGP